MLWCQSMWITRNRVNPRNGIINGYWGPGTGLWCFEPLIYGNQEPEWPDQTLMPHSRMLMKQCILSALLHKDQLPFWHMENLLKWLEQIFSNMPDSQYPRNWFDLDLSCDKPYISISPLVVYKNLLFPAMYSRLEWVSIQIKSSLSVIVECDKIF